MKKALIILAVAGAVISMSSCKKDYTCECVTTVDGEQTSTTPYTFEDQKKGDAEDACDELNTTQDLGGVSYSTTCELK